MSTPQSDDETQMETQGDESQYDETQNFEDEEMDAPESDVEDTQHADDEEPDVAPVADQAQAEQDKATIDKVKQKKREKKDPSEWVREPGKSLLPFSRVQKIIKVDKEIPIVAKEATFLICLATEEFIKRLTEAGYVISQKEKRGTIQHKDITSVTRRADEFMFLEEIMLWSSKSKAKSGRTLDHFVGNDKNEDGDIITNEDGTMFAADNAEDDL